MSDALIQAKIRAFDEFTQTFDKYKRAVDDVGRSQDENREKTDKANKSSQDFLRTLGQVGVLYAFQRGLRDVMRTSMDFEQSMSKVAAISGALGGEFDILRQKAVELGASTVFSASQAAEGMSFLAMAGYETNEIVAAMPGLLSAAAAGGLDLGRAADIASNVLSGFNLEASETARVADILTKAFTSSNTSMEMLGHSMRYVAPIASATKFSLEEMAAAAGLLGNAGIQGEQAGTALRAMILRLVRPPREAAAAMKELGLNITDTNGAMLPLADILANAQSSMADYTDASRAQIAATLVGTEAASAFLSLIETGPDSLRDFTVELENSAGTADRIADTMTQNLAGAITQLGSAVESAKIAIGDEFTPVALGATETIKLLVDGFNSLDENGKKVIAMFIGGAGLVVAIGMVKVAAAQLGITLAAVTGPIGLLVMGVTALSGAYLLSQGRQAQYNQQVRESVHENTRQAESLQNLIKRYEDLDAKTDRSEAEQRALEQVIKDITDAVPSAITGFDSMGNAITNVGIATEETRKKMVALREEALRNAEINAQIARASLPELRRQEEEAKRRHDQLAASMREGNYMDSFIGDGNALSQAWQLLKVVGVPGITQGKTQNQVAFEVGQMAKQAREEMDAAILAVKQAQDAMDLYNNLRVGTGTSDVGVGGASIPRTSGGGSAASGTQTWDRHGDSGSGWKENQRNLALEAAKRFTEELTMALYPYRAATEDAANAVAVLGAREQVLSQVMQSGQSTIWHAVELNKVRTNQLFEISRQQSAIDSENVARKATLKELELAFKAANDPETARTLLSALEDQNRAIHQNTMTWWQLERQRLAMKEQVATEEKRRYDDAYSQAMNLMRHQVAMARMSTEQQIEYLQRLRDAHAWSQSQMWEIESNLYRLRRQQLSDYLGEIDDRHKANLDGIEARTKQVIQSLQAQLDALSEQGKTNQREEAARRHNDKLAELETRRRYHELRTGREHQEAIARIDKEITEEKLRFEQQQQEWSLEDQRDALRKQIDEARSAGDEERRQLEDHYRKARSIAESGIMDVIASLAATGPEWMDTGRQLIDQLIAGLQSGDFSGVQEQIDRIREQAPAPDLNPQMPSFPSVGDGQGGITISAGQYQMIGNTAAMWSRELANLLGVSVSWDGQSAIIGGKPFTPLSNDGGKAYVSIRQVAEALGYRVDWDAGNVNIMKAYEKGGPVHETGPAYLHEGEYVITKSLVDAIRRGSLPPDVSGVGRMGIGWLQQLGDILVDAFRQVIRELPEGDTNFNAPLFHSENTNLEQEVDGEVLGRQLMNSALAVLGAKGS